MDNRCSRTLATLTMLTSIGTLAACDAKNDDHDLEVAAESSSGDDANIEGDSESDEPELPADPAAPGACTEASASRLCDAPGGDGVQYCDTIGEALQWGPCLPNPECDPDGEPVDCGLCDDEEEEGGSSSGGCIGEGWTMDCQLVDGVPEFDSEACETPLVLSFDGAPVQLQATPAATFDISDAGGCITTDWPMAQTPWLALDIDKSGSIETGRELFGSGTRLADGGRARNGFLALADLDDNGDGKIDGADSRFADLVLWGDDNGDKTSTFAELSPLAVRGVLSLELDYAIDRQCDDRGNCAIERASFTFIAAGGEIRKGDIVDVHLACQ